MNKVKNRSRLKTKNKQEEWEECKQRINKEKTKNETKVKKIKAENKQTEK